MWHKAALRSSVSPVSDTKRSFGLISRRAILGVLALLLGLSFGPVHAENRQQIELRQAPSKQQTADPKPKPLSSPAPNKGSSVPEKTTKTPPPKISNKAAMSAMGAASDSGSANIGAKDTKNGSAEISTGSTGNSGAFGYSVTVNVPNFRGLEPKLALSYSSSDKSLGDNGPIIGLGWSLQGLSSIVRNAQTGGVPSYDDTQDVYTLDGEPLLECADAASIAPLGRQYPARYKTSGASASCQSGGHFVTIRENYLRIKLVRVNYGGVLIDNFIVTDKSGNQYTYKPLGELAAQSPSLGGENFQIAFERKFLLASIRNAQTSASEVTFDYDFGALTEGLAERITSIFYGGYSVNFKYVVSGVPLKSFATGNPSVLGTQKYSLKTITILNGNAPVRAYKISVAGAEFSNQSEVTSIQEYGNDFVLTGSNVTGGTALPAHQFKYPDSSLQFSAQSYSGKRFHGMSSSVDLMNDGRADALMLAANYQGSWTTPKGVFDFDVDRAIFEKSTAFPVLGASYDTSYHTEWIDNSYWSSDYYTQEPRSEYVCDSTYGIYMCHWVTTYVSVWHPGTYVHSSYSAQVPDEYFSLSTLVGILPSDVNGQGPDYLTAFSNSLSRGNANGFPNVSSKTSLSLSRAQGNTLSIKATVSVNPNSMCPYVANAQMPSTLIGHFKRGISPDVVFGKKVYSVSNSSLELNSELSAGISDYCSQSEFGAAVVDLNGDGVDEILAGNWVYRIESGAFVKHALSNTPYVSRSINDNGDEIRVVRFGDVNGDGATDAVVHQRGGAVQVYLSNGSGFMAPVTWVSKATIDSFGPRTTDFGSPLTQLADLNGDGMADLIFHNGHLKDSNPSTTNESESARILISTGRGFTVLGGTSPVVIPHFLAAADFDGDGQTDLMSEGLNGVIYWNESGTNTLISSIITPSGGKQTVEYQGTGNSSYVTDSDIPGVQHVVGKVTVDDGRGSLKSTRFTYSGGRYDANLRQLLGYREIEATLPKLSNETIAPTLTSTYLNDHVGRAGLLEKRTLSLGSSVYSQTLNSWASSTSGNGPYSAEKTSERTATRYGSGLIETRKDYDYTTYGEVSRVVDYGFTDPANGSDLNSADTTTTMIDYREALGPYIVNLPAYKRVTKGNSVWSQDRTQWLSAELYTYDGQSSPYTSPIEGNRTKVQQWTGDFAATTLRTVWSAVGGSAGYDDWGNLLQEADAKGYLTSYEYDTGRHLFRMKTTNALSQVAESTLWNTGCQAPAKVTDINGLDTTFTYDAFCRETNRDLPGGQYIGTVYANFGSPTAQYVRTAQPSAVVSAGVAVPFYTFKYFDGLGRNYKTAQTSPLGTLYAFTEYDERGQVASKSNPMLYADLVAISAGTATEAKTTFEYDPLGRLLQTNYPDATKELDRYGSLELPAAGSGKFFPMTTHWDANCYDAATEASTCGKTGAVSDAWGRKIREITYNGTISDIYLQPDTNYTYSLAGNLVKIVDPVGQVWLYGYDAFGNRTSASDPGLGQGASNSLPPASTTSLDSPDVGPWTMDYDASNNLIRQTDAKGQVIQFSYDKLNRVTLKDVITPDDVTRTQFTYDCATGTYFKDCAAADYYGYGKLIRQIVSAPSSTGVYTYPYQIYTDYGQNGQVKQLRNYTNGSWLKTAYTYGIDGNSLVSMENAANATNEALTIHNLGDFGSFTYDVSGRLKTFTNGTTTYISNVVYDKWGNATSTLYGNGAADAAQFNPLRGWPMVMTSKEKGTATPILSHTYDRSATGQIQSVTLEDEYSTAGLENPGSFAYTYDYAGRLKSAISSTTNASLNQTFLYDDGGRITYNNRVGTYSYANSRKAKHAPSSITLIGTAGTASFTYDANGNMTKGLDGKLMEYDGENRPLSVTLNGKKTCYVYGADGARVKKIEGLAAAANCDTAPTYGLGVTLYLGPLEVRDWKAVATATTPAESIFAYPVPNIRLVYDATNTFATALHKDTLGTVRASTLFTTDTGDATHPDPRGKMTERSVFRPYGQEMPYIKNPTVATESKGFIGERYDGDAGLQYLNARYYDPKLAMFIQPDWWEVTKAGVGTNRYAYCHGDPVNCSDTSGNVPDNWAVASNPIAHDSNGFTSYYNGAGTLDTVTYASWQDINSPDFYTFHYDPSNWNDFMGTIGVLTERTYFSGGAFGRDAHKTYGDLAKISVSEFRDPPIQSPFIEFDVAMAAIGLWEVNAALLARGSSVTLYRAIGEREAESFVRSGVYSSGPSMSGKYFAFNLEGPESAMNFATHPFNSSLGEVSMTAVRVPESVISKGTRFFDPGGAGSSIHFADEYLNFLNQYGPRVIGK